MITPPLSRPRSGWEMTGSDGNGAYDQDEGVAEAVGVGVGVAVEPSSDEGSVEDVAAAAKVEDAAADKLDEAAAGMSVGMTPSTK